MGFILSKNSIEIEVVNKDVDWICLFDSTRKLDLHVCVVATLPQPLKSQLCDYY